MKTIITVENLQHTLNSGCVLAVIELDKNMSSQMGIIIPQLSSIHVTSTCVMLYTCECEFKCIGQEHSQYWWLSLHQVHQAGLSSGSSYTHSPTQS